MPAIENFLLRCRIEGQNIRHVFFKIVDDRLVPRWFVRRLRYIFRYLGDQIAIFLGKTHMRKRLCEISLLDGPMGSAQFPSSKFERQFELPTILEPKFSKIAEYAKLITNFVSYNLHIPHLPNAKGKVFAVAILVVVSEFA